MPDTNSNNILIEAANGDGGGGGEQVGGVYEFGDEKQARISASQAHLVKLENNYFKTEKKIVDSFAFLRASLEERQKCLLDELARVYNDRKLTINNHLEMLSNYQAAANEAAEGELKVGYPPASMRDDIDELDFECGDAKSSLEPSNGHASVASMSSDTNRNSAGSANLNESLSESAETSDTLGHLISNFGKIKTSGSNSVSSDSSLIGASSPNGMTSTSSSSLGTQSLECTITGKGLRQCYANEEASFTLSFKNRDGNLAKTNVSFLDLYILTTNAPAVASSSSRPVPSYAKNTMTKSQSLSENLSNRLRPPGSESSSTKSQLSGKAPNRCNCECKLEFLADGYYAVKYKLDKPGVYLLNILVNKVHVGQSPYRINCLESLSTTPAVRQQQQRMVENVYTKQRTKTQPITRTSGVTAPTISSGLHAHNSSEHALSTLATGGSAKKSVRTNSMSQLMSLAAANGNSSRSIAPSYMSNTINHSKQYFSAILNNRSAGSGGGGGAARVNSNGNLNNKSSSTSPRSLSGYASPNLSSIPPPKPLDSSNTSIADPADFSCAKREDDFLFQVGRRGRGVAEFMNPQAVCATNDFIYVSDSNNQKIEAFSHSGEYKFTLGGTNMLVTAKIIRRPIGIDSCEGKIFVVDYEYKCVNVFEESGKFLNRICQNRLLGPKGICINRAFHNQIIIADSKANSICVFNSDGKYITRFGNLGNKNENFAGPQYCTCLSNGQIVITDFYNHCIKVFDPTGQFLFSFGSNGSNQGQFNGPTGIAADKEDNIVVVDWGNSRIQVFDKHGVFIRYINSDYSQLYGPQDLAIINNTIAVADSGNHCVKLYEFS